MKQEGCKDPSCETTSTARKPQKPADPAEEKKKLVLLKDKIADRFQKDTRATEKAAIILSLWINRKK